MRTRARCSGSKRSESSEVMSAKRVRAHVRQSCDATAPRSAAGEGQPAPLRLEYPPDRLWVKVLEALWRATHAGYLVEREGRIEVLGVAHPDREGPRRS